MFSDDTNIIKFDEIMAEAMKNKNLSLELPPNYKYLFYSSIDSNYSNCFCSKGCELYCHLQHKDPTEQPVTIFTDPIKFCGENCYRHYNEWYYRCLVREINNSVDYAPDTKCNRCGDLVGPIRYIGTPFFDTCPCCLYNPITNETKWYCSYNCREDNILKLQWDLENKIRQYQEYIEFLG